VRLKAPMESWVLIESDLFFHCNGRLLVNAVEGRNVELWNKMVSSFLSFL
jgi:hypothetical protein